MKGIGPYECQALYAAWQYGRLVRQYLNCNYFWSGLVMCRRVQVSGGHLDDFGRSHLKPGSPIRLKCQTEPNPERCQVLRVT